MTMADFIKGVDIVKTISGYTGLKKIGKKYWGLCPFHDEKTASFSVDAEKQYYYCFGCRSGGNAVSFIMNKEGVGFEEAITLLSQRAGVPAPVLTNGIADEDVSYKNRLYAANREAAKYYHELLYKPEGRNALEYLRKRGLTDDVIRQYGLGAAPEQWSELSNYLLKKGFTLSELEAAGLTITRPPKSSGGHTRYFDMFRNRAMFPIIDREKHVLAFGGRSLDGQEPKYLNTADTPVYNKRQHVYAENMLQGQKPDRIVLVEGYMDVVSLTQFGIKGVCASLGTALTNEQARIIRSYAPEVYLGYDGDAAGQHAILRGLEIMEEEGIPARVLDFPDGLDPDEFIRRDGAHGFNLLPALTAPAYRLRLLRNKYDFTKAQQKKKYVEKAAEILNALDPVGKEIYIRNLSKETGYSPEAIRRTIEGGKTNE